MWIFKVYRQFLLKFETLRKKIAKKVKQKIEELYRKDFRLNSLKQLRDMSLRNELVCLPRLTRGLLQRLVAVFALTKYFCNSVNLELDDK